MQPTNPRRPVPTKPKLAGSGTGVGSAACAANREKEASRSDWCRRNYRSYRSVVEGDRSASKAGVAKEGEQTQHYRKILKWLVKTHL